MRKAIQIKWMDGKYTDFINVCATDGVRYWLFPYENRDWQAPDPSWCPDKGDLIVIRCIDAESNDWTIEGEK